MKSIKNLYALLVVVGLGYATSSMCEISTEVSPRNESFSQDEIGHRIFDSRETMDRTHQQEQRVLKNKQNKELQVHASLPETIGLDTESVTLKGMHKNEQNTLDEKHEQEKQRFTLREKNRSGWFRADSQKIATELMDHPEQKPNISDLMRLERELSEQGLVRPTETRVEDIIRVLNEHPTSPAAQTIAKTINDMGLHVGIHFNEDTGKYDLIPNKAVYDSFMNAIDLASDDYRWNLREKYSDPRARIDGKQFTQLSEDEQQSFLAKAQEKEKQRLLKGYKKQLYNYLRPVS